MKIKILIGLALVLIPAFLLTAQYQNTLNRPADFRDAVMDPFESSADGQEVTVPETGEAPFQVPEKAGALSALSGLTLKMVSVKAKMERVELSLWEVAGIMENKEGGSVDGALRQLMEDLKQCSAAAMELNAQTGYAMAGTPKTPDTLATAKLLLANIAEYTDNDETIVLIRFENINKEYPAYENKLQPHLEEYMKTLEALSKAGGKVMAFSGPLESE